MLFTDRVESTFNRIRPAMRNVDEQHRALLKVTYLW